MHATRSSACLAEFANTSGFLLKPGCKLRCRLWSKTVRLPHTGVDPPGIQHSVQDMTHMHVHHMSHLAPKTTQMQSHCTRPVDFDAQPQKGVNMMSQSFHMRSCRASACTAHSTVRRSCVAAVVRRTCTATHAKAPLAFRKSFHTGSVLDIARPHLPGRAFTRRSKQVGTLASHKHSDLQQGFA